MWVGRVGRSMSMSNSKWSKILSVMDTFANNFAQPNPKSEMQKVADAVDISVLFFLKAGANF